MSWRSGGGFLTGSAGGGADTLGGLTPTDGNFAVGNGTAWVAESGATARASLGLGTGDSPTFTSLTATGGVNVGGAASAPTGVVRWPSGLGVITHINGPADQQFRMNGGGGLALQSGGTTRIAVSGSAVTITGVPINGADGTAGAPALTGADTDSGIYHGSNTVGIAVGGVGQYVFTTAGLTLGFKPLTGVLSTINANTSDGTDNTDTGAEILNTNRGASGTVTRTAVATTGWHRRYVRVATHAFRLEPSSGKQFRRADGTLEAANAYLELGSDGAMIEVVYDGTEFLVLTERGTINVEP